MADLRARAEKRWGIPLTHEMFEYIRNWVLREEPSLKFDDDEFLDSAHYYAKFLAGFLAVSPQTKKATKRGTYSKAFLKALALVSSVDAHMVAHADQKKIPWSALSKAWNDLHPRHTRTPEALKKAYARRKADCLQWGLAAASSPGHVVTYCFLHQQKPPTSQANPLQYAQENPAAFDRFIAFTEQGGLNVITLVYREKIS